MARLVEMVQGMTSSMTRLQEQHDRAMAKADERHQKLAAENEDLRQRISDLSRQASSDHWRQLKSPHGTVVIGSSIIRDISEEKLVATQCICRRGGVIKDLQEALGSLPTEKPFSRIILIGGGNDCDTDDDDLDVSGITAQYKDLVECAKGKATNVTICSVCPRNKTAAVSQRIESLNAGLKGIASDLGVDFLNNDPIFHLQDGTLNDGYLLADGVHLTRPATNRLVANMQLPLRQGETCAYSDHRRKNLTQDSPAHTSVSDCGDNYSHPFWQKAKQKAQRGQPRGQRPAVRPPFAHKAQQAAGPPVIQNGPVPNPVPVSCPPRRHTEHFQRPSPRQMTPREPRQSQVTLSHVPYPPRLMDIPIQPSLPPQQQPRAYDIPQNPISRSQKPAHAPTHSQDTQCQLCLGWGHSAVTCKSRESKCFACSNYGHFARACPLATQ